MGAYIGAPIKTNRAKIKTGTYVGDGVDDRNIDIGVDLTAKNNVWVIVKCLATDDARHRIEYSQGDLAMHFIAADDELNSIQAFVSVGFQVGTDGDVNMNTRVYRYIVIYEEP